MLFAGIFIVGFDIKYTGLNVLAIFQDRWCLDYFSLGIYSQNIAIVINFGLHFFYELNLINNNSIHHKFSCILNSIHVTH